jgi:hypothetical protein
MAVTVFGCLGDGPVSHADSVPDWLTKASHVDLGHFGEGTAAIIVGDWKDFTVDATGRFVLTRRRAIRILNRRSAQRFLTAVGYENNDTKVQSIQTWAIAPSGRITPSAKKDVITEAGFPGFELFSDDRVKMIDIPGAEDGSTVGFEIVTEGRIPISGEKFRMEEEIPVHQADLSISVPSGSMHWFANHPDRIEVVSQTPTSAVFRAMDRPGIPEESSAPPFSSLAAEVVVNYDPKGSLALQSWEEAGRAYHSLFDGPEKPETEIASQVQTLTMGNSDELSKIDALYNYVSREIRYVAIEIGVGGYQPHPAPDVYKNKYGDCKDKATLLLAMLDHMGLRGYPALVGTRREVEADLQVPTLATFDHMIVALPVPASLRPAVEGFPAYDAQSQILWIDPTSEADPLGQVPEMDQGVFALISYPDHGDLKRIPESHPEQNGTRYTAHLKLEPDGSGTADVRVEYLGAYSTRRHYLYRGLSQDEIRRQFEDRVARYVNQATFRTASISGIEDSRQKIAENFSFTGEFSAGSTGDSWFMQPLFLSGMAVPEVGPRPRQLPLDIGTPERISGVYQIELPAGMRIDRIPEKRSIKSEFGELEVGYSVSENILTATHSLSFTQSRIPPEKYPDFRDFVNAALRAERQRLRVVKIAP